MVVGTMVPPDPREMSTGIPGPPIGAVVPGMAPGTYKRNVLVLLVYLLLLFVTMSAVGIELDSIPL